MCEPMGLMRARSTSTRAACTGRQESARIGRAGMAFLGDRVRMFGRQATVAVCAGGGANAVAKLGDLHGGEVEVGQRVDEARDYRRFSDVAGVPADHD